jgi:hypothetical protein
MQSIINRNEFPIILLGAVCLLLVGIYLSLSARLEGPGFPLDDAWIHLTYARNLGLEAEWAFLPGVSSAGSTAPLWTVLLAIGFWLRLPGPYIWTYALGAVCLIGVAWVGEAYFRRETGWAGRIPWMGIFLAGEFHLAWAAVSGMETVLMAAVNLCVLFFIGSKKPRWGWIGVLTGLAIWVRPDAITLLGPACMVLVLSALPTLERLKNGMLLLGGFASFFVPYLAFNYVMQGSLWPNTFYAKQAEYSLLVADPIILRLVNELFLPLIGAGLLLLPGFLWRLWRAMKTREWAVWAAAIWYLGYAMIYAWRLPVTYQYGRYFIPAMPVFFVLGLQGMVLWMRAWQINKAGRLGSFAFRLALAGMWLGFFVLGARNYARDVAIIESEMVATARWVQENTLPDDLIAVHDIGAMGFFARRDLIDLAGLISPEVIPFIRDEDRLRGYLDQRGAAYLVTFPGWYTKLEEGLPVVFDTQGEFSPAAGGENMRVFRWSP